MEKEKEKIIKTGKLTETFEVFAYTGSVKKNDLKLSGSTHVVCFKEDEKFLPQVQKLITTKDIIDRNRQVKTDGKNGIRPVETDPEKLALREAKTLLKGDPKKFSDLLEYGKQCAQVIAGTLKEVDSELRVRVTGV